MLKINNYFMMGLLVLAVSSPLQAEESTVILPLEAQTCDLPTAPPRIDPEASYEQLVEAKQNVNDFQAAMVLYRGCLDQASAVDALTEGNEVALTQAHNYSVEMEERIAEQFNVAVRAYKARKAEPK